MPKISNPIIDTCKCQLYRAGGKIRIPATQSSPESIYHLATFTRRSGLLMTNINANGADFSSGNSSAGNLAVFDKDGIEIIVNSTTGESYSSISGYARMSGKAQSTISKRIGSHEQTKLLEAEIQTSKGLRTHRLLTEDLIAEWLPKDNPAMATKLIKLGVRGFLHQLAGFKVTSTAIETPSPKPMTQIQILASITAQMALAEQQLLQQDARIAAVEAEQQRYLSPHGLR